jgi:F-type H+-transporting ATPase subunit delta
MKSSKVAIRYAQALLELAVENNTLDSVSRDMSYLVTVNNENRDFQLMLSSPVVKTDKKNAILNEIFGAAEPVSRAFMELITKNGREAILPEIAEAFGELVKQKKGIVSATIISAAPLDASVKQQIVDKIQASVKGTLDITEEIDASLIGGFVVEMGDTRIDASVASKLAQLKQQLTR